MKPAAYRVQQSDSKDKFTSPDYRGLPGEQASLSDVGQANKKTGDLFMDPRSF